MVAGRLAEGDPDGALALAGRIFERYPRDRRTSLLAGRAHLARGDASAARADLERAALAFPDSREVWSELAACGSERAPLMLAELPPLPYANGDRPAISAAALGHLYLRQLLLTHCTAQLEPVWRADATRLDVGVALAEAHWRLGEPAAAEDVCRALLAVAPDCLKANLILAQQLWSAGRRDDAAALVSAATAVDPENEVAEELYEWLTVRDPALVPLHRQPATMDAAGSSTDQAAPEPAPEVVRHELGGIESLLGGIPALHEPLPEPRPFWEGRRAVDLEAAPMSMPSDVQRLAAAAEDTQPQPTHVEDDASTPEPAMAAPQPWSAPSTPEAAPVAWASPVPGTTEAKSEPSSESSACEVEPAAWVQPPTAEEGARGAVEAEPVAAEVQLAPEPVVAEAQPKPDSVAPEPQPGPGPEPVAGEGPPKPGPVVTEAQSVAQSLVAEVLPELVTVQPAPELAPDKGPMESEHMVAEAQPEPKFTSTQVQPEPEPELAPPEAHPELAASEGQPESELASAEDQREHEVVVAEAQSESEEMASDAKAGAEPAWPQEQREAEPVAADARFAPDVAQTSPELALAAVEAEPEQIAAVAFRWVEVSARGQVLDLKPPAGEMRVAGWIHSCERTGERLRLGAPRASSIESSRAAVQLLHEQGAATVALAQSGANLGLVRSSLRRSQQTSEEHNPS